MNGKFLNFFITIYHHRRNYYYNVFERFSHSSVRLFVDLLSSNILSSWILYGNFNRHSYIIYYVTLS